jgi:hypothetical protein
LLPAILLMIAGTLVIVSSVATYVISTDRLLNPDGAFAGTDSRVAGLISTGWSRLSTAPTTELVQPLSGWGLVGVGTVALIAGLLLAGLGPRSAAKQLATLASGLLAGLVLLSALGFAEDMAFDFTDQSQTQTMIGGPAVWLQISGAVLAIVAAILVMTVGRRGHERSG